MVMVLAVPDSLAVAAILLLGSQAVRFGYKGSNSLLCYAEGAFFVYGLCFYFSAHL